MYNKKNSCAILETFYYNTQTRYHIRQLARLTNQAPNTVIKYAEAGVKEGVLSKERERNVVVYYANPQNLLYREMKRNYLFEKIIKSGLIGYLIKELVEPIGIILFGSVAKGEYTKESDIDLFIMTNTKKEINLERYEKILGMKIQPFIFSPGEFSKLNKNLKNDIVSGIRLYGDIEVF